MNEQTIEQSLDAVKKDQALSRRDFANLVRAFALQPDKSRFLLTVNSYNEKLAETLLIFRTQIAAVITAGNDLASMSDQMFLHYIINTNGPIVEAEGSDVFDVFDAATRYGGLLSIDLVKGQDGGSVMHINEKEILCPEWVTGPGRSAALTLRDVGPVINRARYGRNDVIPSYAFGFDENATAHTLKNAMIMADIAHLAYFKSSYIEKQLEAWGYHSF